MTAENLSSMANIPSVQPTITLKFFRRNKTHTHFHFSNNHSTTTSAFCYISKDSVVHHFFSFALTVL